MRVRGGERGLDSFRNSIMRGEATAFIRVGGEMHNLVVDERVN